MFARTLTAAAASALLLATPAFAQAEPMSVEVRTADLDLASEAGQAQLDRRVRNAAQDICGETPLRTALRPGHRECRTAVLEDASQKIAALKAEGGDRIEIARRGR